MSTNFLKITHKCDGVTSIALAKPEKRNAFDDSAIAELRAAFVKIAKDPHVRVVILCAEGDCFSAGADLAWMKRMAAYNYEDNLSDAKALAEMLFALNSLPQPTIARIQGPVYGGAVGLVSCCDIAFASADARFCLSEVKLGLIPATIGPYVISAIGARAARRYFQTAEIFTAKKAADLGLVSECVESGQLDSAIDACVQQLLKNGPKAMAQAKSLIAHIEKNPLNQTLITHTSERIASLRVSPEGQEGLGAFLEKRRPNWREA